MRDIADALLLIMLSDKTNGKTYNVCGGAPLKMRYYTDTLVRLSGLQGVEYRIDQTLWRPIDIHYQDGDATKLSQELGWAPKYTIDKTLEDLLQYWLRKLQL